MALYVKLPLLCPVGSDRYIDAVSGNYDPILDDVTLHDVVTLEIRMLDAHVMST